jgi:hypothetical protein
MELKNNFNKKKKKLWLKDEIESKKNLKKRPRKNIKKNKDWNEKQNIWKIIIEWLN